MGFVYFVVLAVITYSFERANCSDNSLFLKSTYDCKDDVCLKNDHTTEVSVNDQLIDQEVVQIKNVSENWNEEDKSLNTFPDNISSLKNLQDLIGVTKNETDILNTIGSFEIPESTSGFEENDLSTTTISVENTEKSTKPVTKINTSTPVPFLEFLSFQKHVEENNICLCDLKFNQCDINCCCDKDCSLNHFKVFTKCNDADTNGDTKYCFKSSFIFKNSTSHKMVQNKGGLFCIVKDNLRVDLSYKTKPVIKTLDSFNKSLPDFFYSFSQKNILRAKLMGKNYKVGLPVWIVQNGEVKSFGIPAATVGFLCTTQLNMKYLIDQETKCSYRNNKNELECGESGTKKIFQYLKGLKIISNPGMINKSHLLDYAKICHTATSCIGITLYICEASDLHCMKISENMTNPFKVRCWDNLSMIQYHIWHNGSEGIKKFEAYIWVRSLSQEVREHFSLTTKVKYSWIGSSGKTFERSGNPGYLIGKPVLMGRKVYFTANNTVDKKEAIELSFDKNNWLSVLGSEKGICSSRKRIPVNFGENGQYKCLLQLTKDNFGKEKCLELQIIIFKLLIGNYIINATTDNYFNKFVATFGNSKVEETGDWVQVLIDLFALMPSQVGFKSNYNNLICKNIITDLFLDIAYSNIGSFINPQAKILGVRLRFGKHKDLVFYCDTFVCDETKVVRNFQLSSVVHFIDLTEPAADAFAEPLGLEAKLPYDFFYPFFSKGSSFSYSLTTFLFSFFMVYLVFAQLC